MWTGRLCSIVIAGLGLGALGPSSASAQNASDMMNLFGGLLSRAIVENARVEWRKLPNTEIQCIDEQLRQQGSSTGVVIEQGLSPGDPRLSPLRERCRSLTLPLQPKPTVQLSSSKPSFDCAKARSAVARILCADPNAAKADWEVNGAYWAAYFSTPEHARESFVQTEANWVKSLPQVCKLPPNLPDYSFEQKSCVVRAYQARVSALRSQLRGDALAEARMTPEQRATIQSALIARGQLAGEADGEFGSNTRAAIKAFQSQSGALDSGYLTISQVQQLTSQDSTTNVAVKCVISDPTGNSLNIRTGPDGEIATTLDNGASIVVVKEGQDARGRPWSLVARDLGSKPIGWAYRNYIACSPNSVAQNTTAPTSPSPVMPAKATPRLKEAEQFLADVKSYIGSQRTITKIGDVAREAAKLQAAIDEFDETKAAAASESLRQLLSPMPTFAEHIAKQKQARVQAEAEEIARRTSDGIKRIAFIDKFLASNLGDSRTESLLAIRDQLQSAIDQKKLSQINGAFDAFDKFIAGGNLQSAYQSYANQDD